jgi:hypothetical protein
MGNEPFYVLIVDHGVSLHTYSGALAEVREHDEGTFDEHRTPDLYIYECSPDGPSRLMSVEELRRSARGG